MAKIAKGKKRRAKQERAQKKICLSKKEKKEPRDDGKKNNNETMGREKSQASRLLDGGKSGCNGCANQTKGIGDSIDS